jgi:exosome complex RNA-binding protein Rrp4
MHGPRRYKMTGKKNFFIFHLFFKTKKWRSFQANISPSCKFHRNRSKKMAFGTNGLIWIRIRIQAKTELLDTISSSNFFEIKI